ncbi:uncharacterized protein MONBRDRAFT_2133, partial [Monosiga brevicollis MX1]
VTISFADLQSDADLSAQIETGYGEDGLGIVAVTGVPELANLRRRALQQAHKLGQLTKEQLAQYEVPPFFQRGWSCGQEKMKDGKPDFNKGSFYFNPVRDSFEDVPTEKIEKYPTFYGNNVWPADTLGAAFADDVLACARLMIKVGSLVGKHCDAFVQRRLPKADSVVQTTVETSEHHAARLLHYFATKAPTPASSAPADDSDDSWCGWHNDHCTLTGLLPALYIDAASGEPVANPDPKAGLYIKNRKGDVVKAAPPADALLFQIGETAQIMSGGLLKATPHMVQAVNVPNVARCTLAVFMEP